MHMECTLWRIVVVHLSELSNSVWEDTHAADLSETDLMMRVSVALLSKSDVLIELRRWSLQDT